MLCLLRYKSVSKSFNPGNRMIARFSQGIYSAYFSARAVGTDIVQLPVGFFGKPNAGSRIQEGEPHGNAAAVGTGVGVPVFAFQEDHLNGSGGIFHKRSHLSVIVFICFQEMANTGY